MPKLQDISGQRFGRLVANKIAHRKPPYTFWSCTCDCGKETIVAISKLKNGHTPSCGCFHKERIREANITHGLMADGKLPNGYYSWNNIKTRCLNKNSRSYHDYGGRGIKMCERWQGEMGLKNFIDDMGDRPSPGHSVGRIDNNGHYYPENCRWETIAEQSRNTRRSRHLTHNGRTMTVSEWTRELGLGGSTIHLRLKYGWTVEEALTTPKKEKRRPLEEIAAEAACGRDYFDSGLDD